MNIAYSNHDNGITVNLLHYSTILYHIETMYIHDPFAHNYPLLSVK